MSVRMALALVAVAAIALLASCGGSHSSRDVLPTNTPTNEAKIGQAPEFRCSTTPPEGVRDDIAEGIKLGPVFGALSGRVEIPATRLVKVVWLVAAEAGNSVTITGRNLTGGQVLLFRYGEVEGGGPAPKSDTLKLAGPFDLRRDAARGYLEPTSAGCYEIVAEWDSGRATAIVGFQEGP